MNAHHGAPHHSSTIGRRAGLAVIFTAAAASVAWFLSAVAELSEVAVVISVMTIAFVASWIVTKSRFGESPKFVGRQTHQHHRVTMIPIRSNAR